MFHGNERNRTIETPGGSHTSGREKFCVEHGWINLFLIGGKDRWQARHADCNQLPGGTEDEISKVVGQAA